MDCLKSKNKFKKMNLFSKKKFINIPNIIKTSIDIRLDCLKSKNKLKKINIFNKNSII